MKEEENKDIEVVSGSVNDLNISPVYDHIDIEKPKEDKKKKKIIIPKDKNKNGKNLFFPFLFLYLYSLFIFFHIFCVICLIYYFHTCY